MAASSLTFDIFGRDVSASKTVKDFERNAADASENTTKNFQKTADKGVHPLLNSIALLAPALAPIGAAAVAAFAGLAGGAGVAILAFKGIEAEMKAGTAYGVAYKTGLNQLDGQLHQLEQTAARNVLGGFQAVVRDLAAAQPGLNADVKNFAIDLSAIASQVLPGLLRLFGQLTPLFRSLGGYAISAAEGFNHWAGSTGAVTSFVAYAQRSLPTVVALLHNLSLALGHIVEAAAPLGSVVLSALSSISRVIASLPVPVLTAFLAVFEASRIAAMVSGLTNIAQGFVRAKAAAKSFAETDAIASLGELAGPIGGVAAGIGLLVTTLFHGHSATKQYTQDIQSLTDAIQQDGDAIGALTEKQLANDLQQAGALDAAKALGVTLPQVRSAILGNNDALTVINRSISATNDAYQSYIKAGLKVPPNLVAQEKAANTLSDAIYGQNVQVTKAKDAVNNMNAYLGKGSDAMKGVANQAQQTAAQLKRLTAAVQSLGDAQLSMAQSADQVKDAIHNATTQTKQYGTSLNDNTVKGRANREAFLSALQAMKSYTQTQIQAHVPIARVTNALEANVRSLEQQASRAGFSRSQVQALIREMHLTPRQIETTFLANISQLQRNIRAAQNLINSLHGKTVTIQTQNIEKDIRLTNDPGFKFAGGGPVPGIGTSTSDSVRARLSAGEYVMQASAVRRLGVAALNALNNGTAAKLTGPATRQLAASGGAPIVINIPGQFYTTPAAVQNAVIGALEQAAQRGARIRIASAVN